MMKILSLRNVSANDINLPAADVESLVDSKIVNTDLKSLDGTYASHDSSIKRSVKSAVRNFIIHGILKNPDGVSKLKLFSNIDDHTQRNQFIFKTFMMMHYKKILFAISILIMLLASFFVDTGTASMVHNNSAVILIAGLFVKVIAIFVTVLFLSHVLYSAFTEYQYTRAFFDSTNDSDLVSSEFLKHRVENSWSDVSSFLYDVHHHDTREVLTLKLKTAADDVCKYIAFKNSTDKNTSMLVTPSIVFFIDIFVSINLKLCKHYHKYDVTNTARALDIITMIDERNSK